jgi:hypothetical protein
MSRAVPPAFGHPGQEAAFQLRSRGAHRHGCPSGVPHDGRGDPAPLFHVLPYGETPSFPLARSLKSGSRAITSTPAFHVLPYGETPSDTK